MLLFICLLFFLSCSLNTAQTGFTSTCSDSCSLQEIEAMKNKMEIMEAKLKYIEIRMINILSQNNQVSKKVIFSATVGEPGAVGPFNVDTTLVYNTLITNIGSAYSSSTGVFTAPVAGVYYFSFFYHAGGEHQGMLQLYKNHQGIVMTHDRSSETDGADNGGNAVFLQLQPRDQVYVRLAANAHVWGNGKHTSFNGFLVTEM